MDVLTDHKAVGAAKLSDEPAPLQKKLPVRICDYVSFSDIHGHKHIGLVRWIGTDKSVVPDGTTIVGIEADKSVPLTKIPHHIAVLSDRHYVTVVYKGNSEVFLPVQYVQKEKPYKQNSGKDPVKNVDIVTNKSESDDVDINADKSESDDEFYDAKSHFNASAGISSKQPHENNNVTSGHHADTGRLHIFPNSHNLKVGSVVEYYEQSGEIKWIGHLPGYVSLMAGIEMDEDVEEDFDDGSWAGVKYYVCEPNRGKFVDITVLLPYNGPRPKKMYQDQNPHKLEVGSVIQCGEPPKYGVIKWIGIIHPHERMLYAGIEMVENTEHATDGVWKGVKYFESCPGKGKFVHLSTLQPDWRLLENSNQYFKMGKLERENPAMKQATGIAGSREQLGIADRHEEAKTRSSHIVKCTVSEHQEIESLECLILFGVVSTGKELGHGAYGKVVLVEYQEKNYAAKVIHSLLIETANPEEKQKLRNDFLKECSTCSSLRHPNIVGFVGLYYSKGISLVPAMVMELMDTSLTEFVKRSNISMEMKMSILCDVCCGLSYLHNRTPSIIHRDLSPNNVLLSHESVAKISDLGVAKVIKADSKKTKSKLTKAPGTLHFMPPEALDDDNPVYNTSLDVFSFGGITLHVINQEWPSPTSSTAFDTNTRKMRGFTEIERRQKYIDMMKSEDSTLKKMVIDCLDNDPSKRPTAADLLRMLKSQKCTVKRQAFNSTGKGAFVMPPVKLIENVHTGLNKGIQGHHNSCYLDSTLYGLFAFSTAFDDLFLRESPDDSVKEIKLALHTIVNTLRQKYVIHFNAVMSLKDHLDTFQEVKKLKIRHDPDALVDLLFKHVFHAEPFLRIKRNVHVEEAFIIRLTLDKQYHFPQSQMLLYDTFKKQKMTFERHPLRLLLQIPRYGKFIQSKNFKGVIPTIELNIAGLCQDHGGTCHMCGKPGILMCRECDREYPREQAHYFCRQCFADWHGNPSRLNHRPILRESENDDIGRLQLLSVICIESSHYVCFTRLKGSGTNEWVFFDSMAEKQDNVHNLPRVTNCTTELNEWVYGTKDLTRYTPKELPTLVRRFVEDAYLCIYVDHDGVMYGDDEGAP